MPNNSNELMHVGVLGMRWGHRKPARTVFTKLSSGASKVGKQLSKNWDASVEQKYGIKDASKKVGKLGRKVKKAMISLDDRLAKAYGITKKNGRVTMIELDTIPKIAATAFVAKLAINQLAWVSGKIVRNVPLR